MTAHPTQPRSSAVEALIELLQTDLNKTTTIIQEQMQSEHAPRIPEVTAHLVGAGGKRLRPLLVLASAQIFGISNDTPHKLAATVEFIHTATLLHDDVVDESQKRRGRPTANLLWDNKSSILVGDFLFARAFRLMVATGSLRVLDILSTAAATIAEGEVLQMIAAGNIDTTEDTYLQIVKGKTAALFSAATETGGLVSGATDAQAHALREYGEALGVAFQIADDVLDFHGSVENIGKNTGDDFRERKLTLPIIKAISKASPEERVFWDRTIGRGNQTDDDVSTAKKLLSKHNALGEAENVAFMYSARAHDALEALPQTTMTDLMRDLTKQVVSRLR